MSNNSYTMSGQVSSLNEKKETNKTFLFFYPMVFALDKCLYPRSNDPLQMKSYQQMLVFVAVLCAGALASTFATIYVDAHVYSGRILTSEQSFSWCKTSLFFLFTSTLCGQIVSLFGCRPIETIYDSGYFALLLSQIGGLILCVDLAYVLGAKSILRKRFERQMFQEHPNSVEWVDRHRISSCESTPIEPICFGRFSVAVKFPIKCFSFICAVRSNRRWRWRRLCLGPSFCLADILLGCLSEETLHERTIECLSSVCSSRLRLGSHRPQRWKPLFDWFRTEKNPFFSFLTARQREDEKRAEKKRRKGKERLINRRKDEKRCIFAEWFERRTKDSFVLQLGNRWNEVRKWSNQHFILYLFRICVIHPGHCGAWKLRRQGSPADQHCHPSDDNDQDRFYEKTANSILRFSEDKANNCHDQIEHLRVRVRACEIDSVELDSYVEWAVLVVWSDIDRYNLSRDSSDVWRSTKRTTDEYERDARRVHTQHREHIDRPLVVSKENKRSSSTWNDLSTRQPENRSVGRSVFVCRNVSNDVTTRRRRRASDAKTVHRAETTCRSCRTIWTSSRETYWLIECHFLWHNRKQDVESDLQSNGNERSSNEIKSHLERSGSETTDDPKEDSTAPSSDHWVNASNALVRV